MVKTRERGSADGFTASIHVPARGRGLSDNRLAHFHKCTFSHMTKLGRSLICSFISQTFSNKLCREEGPPATAGAGEAQRDCSRCGI